jgi:hypothetical protein
MKKKKEVVSDYELVPEKRFLRLEKSLKTLSKNPILKVKHSDIFARQVELLHDSIISLLEVLKSIKDDTSIDSESDELFKKEIKPLVQSVHEIKHQNETIASGMINIIDRLNDFQRDIETLKEYVLPPPSFEPNPQLPPLSGGPTPPSDPPGPLPSYQGVGGNAIPPLEMGELGRK